MKKWIGAAACIVIVLLGLNLAAPQLAEYGLYRALSQKMEMQRQDVQVSASPGLSVLAGRLDRVQASGSNFKVGKLRFQSLQAELAQVTFRPLDSLSSGRLTVESAAAGELTATVTEEDLRTYLQKQVRGADSIEVTFRGQDVHLSGNIKAGGFLKGHMDITGRFGMEGTKLMFLPSDVTVSVRGFQLGGNNVGKIALYDFADFPLHMVPDRVTLADGVLTLHGVVNKT